MVRILVVDDEKPVREAISLLLKQEGYRVVVAECGHTALGAVETFTFDLVIVDIFMPGMNGIDLLRRLSADVRNCAARMYVVSAADDEDLRSEARRCGADGFLKKPLHRKTLLDLLAV
ncbi:MAG: response regulator [Myxococcales bacterium]